MIYFIKCNEFVKIGRGVSGQHRLESLQTGNPYKLELLYEIEEKYIKERNLHDLYAKYLKHHDREWFKLDGFTDIILEALEVLKKVDFNEVYNELRKVSSRERAYL